MPSQTAVAINAKGAVMSYQLEVTSPRPCWQTSEVNLNTSRKVINQNRMPYHQTFYIIPHPKTTSFVNFSQFLLVKIIRA